MRMLDVGPGETSYKWLGTSRSELMIRRELEKGTFNGVGSFTAMNGVLKNFMRGMEDKLGHEKLLTWAYMPEEIAVLVGEQGAGIPLLEILSHANLPEGPA